MYQGIYKWTSSRDRKKIADRFGVKSASQIRRIITGECHNFPLLEALIEQAEKNKALTERNEKLLEEFRK